MAWIDTFVAEKGYDLEEHLEVPGPTWGANLIPLSLVVDAIRAARPDELAAIKKTLIALDFTDPEAPKRYLTQLAQNLAL